MHLNTTRRQLRSDNIAADLVEFLENNESKLNLVEAQIYFNFPIFKDLDGAVIICNILLVSPEHGVIAISTSDLTLFKDDNGELKRIEYYTDQVLRILFSRLIRNKTLTSKKMDLSFPLDAIIFTPLADEVPKDFETTILSSNNELQGYLDKVHTEPIMESIFTSLIATIEGANGLIRPKIRKVRSDDPHAKGNIIRKIEAEIASFDQHQKYGYMSVLDGLQRIRGLAGSGKTVVLCMKAALMHLREPTATVVYTFYTKSLYQFIKRLVTRFYRQFDDRDPDWTKLKIMHAWGGFHTKGVYSDACEAHDVPPISYSEASQMSGRDAFENACKKFLSETRVKPIYDYLFIDEGQDFSAVFIRLCADLTKNERVVWAYDDLQTIFQPATPAPAEIFGTDEQGNPRRELTEDIVLYKCYRNPREIIFCAHSLGFGIFGPRIVQMLENKGHWEDIGYKVISGDFSEGSFVEIERPAEFSPTIISEEYKLEEIVEATVHKDYKNEINTVAKKIRNDIDDGLNPDDILVITVDDRHAKNYLIDLEKKLAQLEIRSNNVHADSYGLRDFFQENSVTLSTVHKAKGNEAFMVYVVGVDALYPTYAGVRERNILFTAITRAKAWVRVSGIGKPASDYKKEIETALKNFPYFRFKYPSEEQLKIMRRDLERLAIKKQKVERMLDRVLEEMTPGEIQRFIDQRSIKKGEH